jgi:BASS family bile acid:Na+ symporter
VGLHYLVMPLAAWLPAKALRMPPDLATGMILVGSVASGTASNVMIYLARGDVALSITISALSTLVGVVATPLLTRLYVSAQVTVDVMAMLLSIVQIVALPVAAGSLLAGFWAGRPPKDKARALPSTRQGPEAFGYH